jgi:hypothetical protein
MGACLFLVLLENAFLVRGLTCRHPHELGRSGKALSSPRPDDWPRRGKAILLHDRACREAGRGGKFLAKFLATHLRECTPWLLSTLNNGL